MSLLLANSRITSLLAAASPTATEAGQFALTQDFLAQTAMIAAETNTSRSLVVAPPANWDPSPAEAATRWRSGPPASPLALKERRRPNLAPSRPARATA